MTRFICPSCQQAAFYAHAPMFDYSPRRWLLWLPPRKRWIGDLVRCANAKCGALAVAGPGGVIKLDVPAEPAPAAPPADGPPERRPVSQVFDRDLRWNRR